MLRVASDGSTSASSRRSCTMWRCSASLASRCAVASSSAAFSRRASLLATDSSRTRRRRTSRRPAGPTQALPRVPRGRARRRPSRWPSSMGGSEEVVDAPRNSRAHGWQRREKPGGLSRRRSPADGPGAASTSSESFVGVLAEEGGATTWVVCHHGPEEERAPVTRSTNHQAALFQ